MFRIPIILTILAVALTWRFGGTAAALTVAILGVLEISFSFDNAIVNAKILGRMPEKWQKLFLTLGILIAVFGMRLLFPLVIVALAAHLNPVDALRFAAAEPDKYAQIIHGAHPAIAGFGGTFLLMLFLDWVFEERDIHWLRPIERLFQKIGRLENMTIVITALALVACTALFGHVSAVLTAGLVGMAIYLLVSGLDGFFEAGQENDYKKFTAAKAIGTAGLGTFLYLEVLDASFSFDGVVGAFAVTNNVFYIAIGLGIGALYVRALTVYLTRKGVLSDYRYLEHGAHWAIGVLAVLLLISIGIELNDVITGLVGVVLISAAFISSLTANKKEKS